VGLLAVARGSIPQREATGVTYELRPLRLSSKAIGARIEVIKIKMHGMGAIMEGWFDVG
jgi:hypothetical protein